MFIHEYESKRNIRKLELCFDLVIAGGGMTGVCGAITAARKGIKVALIQDRPVLGGNASSEVRLWVLGATSHMGNNNRWSREGGIIDEILVENTYRNKEGNPVLFDMVLMDKVLAEPNISLFLNTVVYDIEKENECIRSICAFNPQNATGYRFEAPYFSDCTGDGILAYMAGASYRVGAEDREELNEGFAPDKQHYGELLGHSILFYVKDTGKPVHYTAPDFALKNAEQHIPKLNNPNYFNIAQHGCKYWWLEYGGRFDTIADTEQIKYELWKVVYGVWDYIKNSGKFPQTENLTLEWAGLFPGKRESRRFKGYYMLNQQDIVNQHQHYDAVAYGGWSIDLHPADGVYSPMNGCNQWHSKGIYQIPYRCYVSPEIKNLFLGGRIMSASHVAHASSRVMCTAAHGGQAIGMAAALCVETGNMPEYFVDACHIRLLQNELVKTGQFIPGIIPQEDHNLLATADITVSSELALKELKAGEKTFRLAYPIAQILPVCGQIPQITVQVIADEDTELEVELRRSSKPENFTPDVACEKIRININRGEKSVNLCFNSKIDKESYIFVCFMTNEKLSLRLSDQLVSGITSVFNYINPSVSNYGKQVPPEGLGVDEFEFWCPKRRPEGQNIAMSFDTALSFFGKENLRNVYYRPFIKTNVWCADFRDENPELRIGWQTPHTVSSVRLYWDTDADHAMENVQMGHFDAVMPFCVRHYRIYDDRDNLLCEKIENHQTINDVCLESPVKTSFIRIVLEKPLPVVPAALFGIRIE